MGQDRLAIAQRNHSRNLQEGKLLKTKDAKALKTYLYNANLSLGVAEELAKSKLNPHLWIIVCSYYAQFYAANAVLLTLGYKTTEYKRHVVTTDALYVLVLKRLKQGLLESFEEEQERALELASAQASTLLENYEHAHEDRNDVQYETPSFALEARANLSLLRAREFLLAMKGLLS